MLLSLWKYPVTRRKMGAFEQLAAEKLVPAKQLRYLSLMIASLSHSSESSLKGTWHGWWRAIASLIAARPTHSLANSLCTKTTFVTPTTPLPGLMPPSRRARLSSR